MAIKTAIRVGISASRETYSKSVPFFRLSTDRKARCLFWIPTRQAVLGSVVLTTPIIETSQETLSPTFPEYNSPYELSSFVEKKIRVWCTEGPRRAYLDAKV